jgi:uncharacterized membrane protein YoaK (UPF0700 family)
VPLVSQPTLSGTLRAAAALTVAAGFADAHIFLNVTDVFVANMSGNLVFMGISAGEGQWRAGVRHAAALVAFGLGAAMASWAHDHRRRAGRPLRPDLLLGAEALLLALVVVWTVVAGDGHGGERAVVYPVIVLGGFAMGMQNSALLRVGTVAVATTFASGSVARLGSESALAAGAADGPSRSLHSRAVRVLGAIVAAYVAGAALAAWAGPGGGWLVVPVAILSITAVAVHRRLREIGADPWDKEARPAAGGE